MLSFVLDVCAFNGKFGASGFNGCHWCDLGFPNQDCKSLMEA